MKTKYIKRKYPKFYILAAFTLLCFLAVGYSYINSDLGIEASALAASNRWNIVISNMQVNSSSTYGSQTNNSTGSQLTFDLSLTSGGQSYIIDFDVTNNGTLNAYLKEITYDLTDYNNNLDAFLEYKYTYSDGTEVKVNDLLAPNQTVHMKLYINYTRKLTYEYNESINSKSIAYGININYYFKGNQKEKIDIYDNDNKKIGTKYISENVDYVEIDSDESYKLVACYGASAYEENNKIRISYIDGETETPFCRILTDLYSINKLSTNDYPIINIYLLKDYQYQNNQIFYYEGNATIYLNGKNLSINGYTDSSSSNIISIDTLNINNNTGNSAVNIYDKALKNKNLDINGGTYNIIMSVQDTAINSENILIENATINVSNTDFSRIIQSNYGTAVVNSTINAYYSPLSIYPYDSPDNYIAVLNSIINTSNSYSIGIYQYYHTIDYMYNVYICNSTIDSATYDIDNTYGSVIYSSNSHFNSTAPTLKTPNINTYLIEDDFACNIINQRIKKIREDMLPDNNTYDDSGEN